MFDLGINVLLIVMCILLCEFVLCEVMFIVLSDV